MGSVKWKIKEREMIEERKTVRFMLKNKKQKKKE